MIEIESTIFERRSKDEDGDEHGYVCILRLSYPRTVHGDPTVVEGHGVFPSHALDAAVYKAFELI